MKYLPFAILFQILILALDLKKFVINFFWKRFCLYNDLLYTAVSLTFLCNNYLINFVQRGQASKEMNLCLRC